MNIQLQIRNAAEKDTQSMKEIADFIEKSEERDKKASTAAKNAKNENVLDKLPVRGEEVKKVDEAQSEGELMHEKGNELFKQKKYAEALATYTIAIGKYTTTDKEAGNKISPKGDGESLLAQIYGNIGLVYQKLNNSEKAMDYYNKSILLAPEYSKVLVRRARIYANEQNNIADALADYGIALPKLTGAIREQIQNEIEKLKSKMQTKDETIGLGKKVKIQFECNDTNDEKEEIKKEESASKKVKIEIESEEKLESTIEKEKPIKQKEIETINETTVVKNLQEEQVKSKNIRIEFENEISCTSIKPVEQQKNVTNNGENIKDKEILIPPVPDSPFAFYSGLCQLYGRPKLISQYLNSFHTALLPKYLSSQIGEKELGSVAEALNLYPLTPKKNINILFAFMSLDEFEIIKNFIDPEIKANIRRIVMASRKSLGTEADTGVIALRIEKVMSGYSL